MKLILYPIFGLVMVMLIYSAVIIGITFSETPSNLSYAERVRWEQATPSARSHLAELWDIPREEAEKYGARY